MTIKENIFAFNRNALIDETVTNTFTDDHLETHNLLCPIQAYPEMYEDLQKGLRFHSRLLVNREQITTSRLDRLTDSPRQQDSRVGGGIGEESGKDLTKSFHDNGVHLRQPAPCLFLVKGELGSSDAEYRYITGQSRDEFVWTKYNFDNIIANVYVADENATTQDIENALSFHGVFFNPKELANNHSTMESIQKEAINASLNQWIDGTDYQQIHDRVYSQGKNVGLSDAKIQSIIHNVLNIVGDPSSDVYSWTADSAKEWMKDKKFIDTGSVKYIIRSARGTFGKALTDTIKLAKENPNHTIRLVVHTGSLASDPATEYPSIVEKFFSKIESLMDAISVVGFNGQEWRFRNVELYGVLPAVGVLHNLNKLVKFRYVDNTDEDGDNVVMELYQK